MINNVTGVILAGGRSTRMGGDKAFLKIGGCAIIEEIFSKLKNIFSRIIIVANEIERFGFLEAQITPDIIPYKGPLGGIYTSLIKSNSFYNFITACDTPFLNMDLIKFMITKKEGYDVVLPEENKRLEPLYAIYSKGCIKAIEIRLRENNLKIIDFLPDVKVRKITGKEIAMFDKSGKCFANINTPADYKAFVR